MNIFTVLKNNICCALCREKKCYCKYMPERKSRWMYDGHIYASTCVKVKRRKEERFYREIRAEVRKTDRKIKK